MNVAENDEWVCYAYLFPEFEFEKICHHLELDYQATVSELEGLK